MPNLAIMVPVRGRKANCERLIKAYHDTTEMADMYVILDPDDVATYDGVDWGRAKQCILDPRGMIGPKRNFAARALMDNYAALMCAEDDIVPGPSGWDTTLMNALADMGGTGMIYPNDDRRTDIPENVLISSDIVRALGWFCEPSMQHYYIDNVWADIGHGAGCLKLVPEVMFENFHYTMRKSGITQHDRTYSEAEKLGPADAAAYASWRQFRMAADIATVKAAVEAARV